MLLIRRLAVPVLVISLVFAAFSGASALAQGAYSDAKLESYVQAVIQVQDLMREYKPQVDAAESPKQADNLRREAKGKMDAAIIETPGITIDEYVEILLAARSDQALHGRIDTLYRAASSR